MSEETVNNSDSNSGSSSSSSKRSKKENEIFGIPQSDLTLGIAAAAGLGVLGLAAWKVGDMMKAGEIPNPFAPQNPRVTYSDIYEQQRQQQEWQQQQQQQQGQQAALPRQVEGGDPNAQTMPALNSEEYQGFDDSEDGVSYSTAPPRKVDRFNRINVQGG